MARPKKDRTDRKATFFRFRCTDEEKAIIDQAAKLRSLDASAWGRSELIGLAKRLIARESTPTPATGRKRPVITVDDDG